MKKNVFQQAIEDMWNIPDFLDQVVINGELTCCWVTKREEQVIYGETGLEEECPFTITLKLPLARIPKQGDRVSYQGENYKIASTELDSASTTISLNLVKPSKGV